MKIRDLKRLIKEIGAHGVLRSTRFYHAAAKYEDDKMNTSFVVFSTTYWRAMKLAKIYAKELGHKIEAKEIVINMNMYYVESELLINMGKYINDEGKKI